MAVGAYFESSNATGVGGDETDNSVNAAGAAYVFTRSGSTWSQQEYLKPSDTGVFDLFGFSVAVSGDTVVVGSREDSSATGVNGDDTDNSAANAGAAYVFKLTPSNQAPIADAGLDQPAVECGGPKAGCAAVTLDGSGSSDPDGDALTYTWEPGSLGGAVINPILPLGTHVFTLTVDDGKGGTDTDTVSVTVVDTTPPVVTAALVPIDVNKNKGTFEVQFSCTDACDSDPAITTATLNGVEVTNGQIVELQVKKAKSLKSDKSGKSGKSGKSEKDDAILSLDGPAFELTVTCVDGAGNEATATATPAFAAKSEKSEKSEKSAKSEK